MMFSSFTSRAARLYVPLFLPFLFWACSSGAEITEQPEQEPEVSEERPMSSMLSSGDYNELRISPGARNMAGEAEIPAVFVEDEEDESGRESDSGFRIQLMSTTDIAVADSMSLEYYDWIETLDAESISFSPVPDAYITFRQPYYRVRIGDFRQRSQANTYLRLLRERFQGAWVVLDTIDPEMVPEP